MDCLLYVCDSKKVVEVPIVMLLNDATLSYIVDFFNDNYETIHFLIIKPEQIVKELNK